VGALAAMVAHLKIEVVRTEEPEVPKPQDTAENKT
jgi:hypothetical protein